MNRFISTLLACVWFSVSVFAADGGDFLPKSFAGWTQSGQPQISDSAAKADSAYPAVLKEYGFNESETATYTRDDGRKLTIKAARFDDATGSTEPSRSTDSH